jgi:hypothetical protein
LLIYNADFYQERTGDVVEFQTKFPTEKEAVDYFFVARYHNELTCPYCGAESGEALPLQKL